jgi:cell division protein FtsB
MIQSALNRGQWPDLEGIDALLDAEFEAWTNKLHLEGQRIADAELRLRHLVSDEQDYELKKLYYGLVKKLHPDLNPVLTEDQKRLWLRVQAAYESSDLEELRALSILADRSPLPASQANSLERLTAEQRTLDQQIRRLLQEIEVLENRPPLTWRNQLTDPDWVAGRCWEIRAEIDRLEKRCAALQAQVTLLMGGNSDGERPGQN